MKGFGTNEKKMIKAVADKNNWVMKLVRLNFEEQFPGRSLLADFKDELSGNLEKSFIQLIEDQHALDARSLKKAMSGFGTDEDRLDEIILFRSAFDLRAIRESYAIQFQSDLLDDLNSECSGDHYALYVTALTSKQPHDPYQVEQDVKDLYDAGENKIGTDEAAFAEILARSEPKHIDAIKAAYEAKHGKTLLQVINSEFGILDDGDMVRSMKNIAMGYGAFLGKRLLKAMEGVGTDDGMLQRLILSHRESGRLREAHLWIKDKTNKGIRKWIKNETSGKYEDLLIAIVEHWWSVAPTIWKCSHFE